MSYHILQVVNESNFVWPKPYEDFIGNLKKETALQAELDKIPARTWLFLKLAKESFILAVPKEDQKTKPEM